LAGAIVATLGVAWLKGRAAGKLAWEAKRRTAPEKARQQSSEIRHDVQNDSDAGLADRAQLEALRTDRNTSRKVVWRVGIVLATADGCGTNEIMRRSETSRRRPLIDARSRVRTD